MPSKYTSSKSKLTQPYRNKDKYTYISAKEVAIYTQCPKKYEYWVTKRHALDELPLSSNLLFLKKISKYAYTSRNKSGMRPAWQAVTNFIDKLIFQDVNMSNEEEVDIAYKRSLSLIEKIRKEWYIPIFCRYDEYSGITDWWDAIVLPNNYIVHDTVDLVLYDGKEDLIICEFSEVEDRPRSIYNDIRLRIQALILSNELGISANSIKRIVWGKSNKITTQNINIQDPDDFLGKTLNSIMQITTGIKKDVFYVSVSEQCHYCPFRDICSM